MIYSNIDSFYISAEQLEASPSRTDGIDADTERTLRHLCCDLVAEATILLRLPQVVAATAQVLVQRFYCKRSLKRFDVKVRPACWPKGGGVGGGGGRGGWQQADGGMLRCNAPCRVVVLVRSRAAVTAATVPPCRRWRWQPSGWPASWRR